jgi:hypothetical protein
MITKMNKKYQDLLDLYPFLSVLRYESMEFVGIIQNSDTQVVSFYDFELLPTQDFKINFLKLGEQWWWESNRQMPINIFLRQDFRIFAPYLKTLNSKNCEIVYGPVTCLNNFFEKRVKKRTIQLVRKVNNS